MTGVVGNEGSPFVQVVIGVDTHQEPTCGRGH